MMVISGRSSTRLSILLAIAALTMLVCAVTGVNVALGQGSAPAGQVAADAGKLDAQAQRVDELVAAGNWPQARVQWRAFQDLWLDVEDPFRDLSRDGYANIETEMVRVGDSLRLETPDASTVRPAIVRLRGELAPFAQGKIGRAHV